MRETHCIPVSQVRRGRLLSGDDGCEVALRRGLEQERESSTETLAGSSGTSGSPLLLLLPLLLDPGRPPDQEIPPAYLGGELASLAFSNPLTSNPSLMPLEEVALNRNQLRPLPLSASQALPFKGRTRLPNPPQGPNAIVSLLQLCWEAWLFVGGWGGGWGGGTYGDQQARVPSLGRSRRPQTEHLLCAWQDSTHEETLPQC